MTSVTSLGRLICALLLLGSTVTGFGQSTAFCYQGHLTTGTGPATGLYDLQFALFATNSGGTASAGPIANYAVPVTNGWFATTIDFGSVFNGADCWLEIGARTNGGTTYVTLAPRQKVMPVPTALYAGTAGYAATAGSVPASALSGAISLAQLPAAVVTNGPDGTLPLAELPAGWSTNAGAATPAVSLVNAASGTSSGTINSNTYGFLDTQLYGGYATVPPICFNTWNAWYTGYNSNAFVRDLTFLQQTAPILLNYNQQGFALCIDDGLFSSRVNGVLKINPANFPWTAQQLVAMAHTNGVRILCYMEPNAPGVGGTSAGFPDSEGTNIEWDAQQFALMGFDGLKIDPHGWDNSNLSQEVLATQRAEAAFRQAAPNRSAIFLHDESFYTDEYGGQPSVSEIANAFPGTIVRLRSEFGDDGNPIFGWAYYLTNYIDNIVGLQALNKPGQWLIPVETPTDDQDGSQCSPVMNRMIELSSAEFGGPVLFDQLAGVTRTSLAMMTNTEILDVAYDPLWIIGQPVPNVGSSNTFEVFVKTLDDPYEGKELFLLNRSTNTTQTAAFAWPDIGYASGRQILVRDTQAQTNFGVYSNSFALNLGPMQCYLLRFEPVDNSYLDYLVSTMAGETATNIIDAALAGPLPAGNLTGTVPDSSISTNWARVTNTVSTVTAGTNTAVTVTSNPDGSKSVRVDGLSATGLQLLLQQIATLTNNVVLPPQANCPLVICNGASGIWNSNGLSTWLRTSSPGSTVVTDHLLFMH